MNSKEKNVVNKIVRLVKKRFAGEGSGHDWWHIYRVWMLAKQICAEEKANACIVELAALLHDISDWKFNGGDDKAGGREARVILLKHKVAQEKIDAVCEIIDTLSFKGAGVKTPMRTPEGAIVQDADRIDAMGAVGIARTFAYGGYVRRPIYDPAVPPILHQSKALYKKRTGPSLNHFYEKLLLLKDRINTKAGRKIAKGRHLYMQKYLSQFHKEWNGKL